MKPSHLFFKYYFLVANTLPPRSASLKLGVKMWCGKMLGKPGEMLGGNLGWTYIPSKQP